MNPADRPLMLTRQLKSGYPPRGFYHVGWLDGWYLRKMHDEYFLYPGYRTGYREGATHLFATTIAIGAMAVIAAVVFFL